MSAWRRVVVPLLGAALAAALLLASRGLDTVSAPGQLGPAFWPRLVLAGLLLTCLVKAVADARHHARGTGGPAHAPMSAARLSAGIGAILLYVALTPHLGFPLVTALFIVAFMALCGARSPWSLGANAALGTALLLYLFVKFVYLPLPKGAGAFERLTLLVYRGLHIF